MNETDDEVDIEIGHVDVVLGCEVDLDGQDRRGARNGIAGQQQRRRHTQRSAAPRVHLTDSNLCLDHIVLFTIFVAIVRRDPASCPVLPYQRRLQMDPIFIH